jgi:DNA-binding CsgD family transcriptional regulator
VRNVVRPSGEASRPSRNRYAALRALVHVDPIAPLQTMFDTASAIVVEAIGADALDTLLYDAPSESLIAVRAPRSQMARLERTIGVDRLPLRDGGLAVRVFQDGSSFRTGHRDTEPDERLDIAIALESRSGVLSRIQVGNEVFGVLDAHALSSNRFTAADQDILEAAARVVAKSVIVNSAATAEPITLDARRRDRRSATGSGSQLSAREQEITALVARGLTNTQIADGLGLAPGTVAKHMIEIMGKLGVESRLLIAVSAGERDADSPSIENR